MEPESLQTARLLLRRPTLADAVAIFDRYASDPVVTRYLSWPTHRTLADTHAFLAWSDAEWGKGPAGSYLVFSREDNRLLGGTGLSFKSPTCAVTGYVLARDAWGRGYATESLQAMVDLARELGRQAARSALSYRPSGFGAGAGEVRVSTGRDPARTH